MKKIFLLFLIQIFFSCSALAETEKQNINILYTIDDNYPIFTLLSINSVLKNNISKSSYTFYIIESDLTDKNKALMSEFIQNRGQECYFINIKTPFLRENNFYSHPIAKHISSIAMARLFAPNLLPESIKKILYLDADLIALSDLKELYDTKLGTNIVAMVKNNEQNIYDKSLYNFENGYFNSGVILIDLEKCRRENSSKQFIEYYKGNQDKFGYKKNTFGISKLFYLTDQDLINIVWDGRILPLEGMWNQQFDFTMSKGILHFIGNVKPWDFSIKSNSAKIYFDYWDTAKELKMYKYLYFVKSIWKNYCKKANSLIQKHIKYLRTIKLIILN